MRSGTLRGMDPEPIIEQADGVTQPDHWPDLTGLDDATRDLAIEVFTLRDKLVSEGTPETTAHTLASTYVMVSRLYQAFEALGSSPMGRSLMRKAGRHG